MNKRYMVYTAFLVLFLAPLAAMAQGGSAIPEMLKRFEAAGGHDFSADRGRELWHRKVIAKKDGKPRSCTTCHGQDLTQGGKHVRSGKPIDPMAVSVNPERFTETKKIRKWFRRNCKWTWGRKCTAQEKGDILTYLAGQ